VKSNSEYKQQKFIGLKSVGEKTANTLFSDVTFDSCDFSGSSFENCNFENCLFIGCNLSVVKLNASRLLDTKFKTCKLTGIDWSVVNKIIGITLHCEDCDLSYCMFANLDLTTSKFLTCKITESEFSGCVLKRVEFCGSDLLNTRIAKNNLTEADFSEAKNYFFDLSDNTCKKATFTSPEVLNLLLPFGIVVR
jgi:uncharacterized protein YjbI with pentapeptide repeats